MNSYGNADGEGTPDQELGCSGQKKQGEFGGECVQGAAGQGAHWCTGSGQASLGRSANMEQPGAGAGRAGGRPLIPESCLLPTHQGEVRLLHQN